MRRNKEKIALTAVLVVVMALSILLYLAYIQRQIYYEGTSSMLETYEQVDKTFTMFAQRNWNVLSDWGASLRDMADPETATQFRNFDEEKKTWNYSDFYMVNEDWQYWTVDGRQGVGENLKPAFEQLYAAGEPTVASYTATSGKRKVVFMVPCEPIMLEGVTYTSLAVSYDNDIMEEMIGGRAYGGRSDCYIVYPNGDIMLSEEPKSEITDWMQNLFDYLEHNTRYDATAFSTMKAQVAQGGSGSIQYVYEGRSYYLVYQPVGFQNLTMVGIVERDVVDAGMKKVQYVTILMLLVLSICVVLVLVRSIKADIRLMLEDREKALHAEAVQRKKLESLANTDGLTGLFNERYFNELFKQREETQEPFALFYLDLDRFKPVNDTYGHDVGDQLLKAVARRLWTCARASDFVFRIGGDEFAILISGHLDETFCIQRAEKIRTVVSAPYRVETHTLEVGTSCGYALYPADASDVKGIRILADRRMYADKQARRGGAPADLR